MATVAVTFNGTRITDSDSATNWSNWGSSGPAPASEYPLAYQVTSGTTTGAVNKKITSGTLGGFQYDPGSGAVNMSSTYPLWFAKCYASDAFDLVTTYGLKLALGSANTAYYEYCVAGTNANLSAYNQYPAQGGYLITSINPNIAAWREATQGSPSLTAVDWFGIQAAFINGTAKAENLALDSIDVGTGLYIVGGDGASTDGVFTDFVATDQNTKANRWGVVTGAGSIVRSHGLLTIGANSGGAVATGFTDDTSIVLFPDGYHARGNVGVLCNISSASTTINIGALLIGEGTRNGVDANDTRPDFTVTGTSGTFSFSGRLRNFRDVTFTSVCSINGATIQAHLLVQSGSHIRNSLIRTNSLTSVACLQAPTFGTSSGLHDCDFLQTGAGHAIEISSAGDYTFTNLTFTGYGADTTDSAAIDVTASSGTVNITVSGGSTPTYKSAGATVNIIAGAVTVKVTAVLVDGTPVQSARVHLRASNGTGPFPYQESVSITRSGSTATVAHTAHGLATNDKVLIYGSEATEPEYVGVKQITVTGTNSYTYTVSGTPTTPASGTITSTFVALDGVTDTNGELSVSRVYSSNQPVTGWTRKSTSSPYLQQGILTGSISSTGGYNATAVMAPDE